MMLMPTGARPDSLVGRHPSIPWILLITASIVLVLAVDQWAKILPAILGYGILGGLMMLFSGHVQNRSSVHISRTEGTVVLLFAVIAIFLSRTLQKRRLDFLDRVAFVVFGFAFAFGLSASVVHNSGVEFASLAIGLCSLLVPWTIEHVQHRNVR